jgi:hypothetical protein
MAVTPIPETGLVKPSVRFVTALSTRRRADALALSDIEMSEYSQS